MIDYSLEPRYQEIFDYLSLKAKEAYKDVDMLSNETLSRNPYSSVFIKQKLENATSPTVDMRFILKKLFTYYKKSFKGFYYYLANFYIYLRYAKRFNFENVGKELIIIDTFFIIDKVLEQKESFSDGYFGLDDTLCQLDKPYAYLPVFYGLFSPAKMKEVFSILRKKEYPVVCEYDLLSLLDYVRILCFIIRYPFKVISFTASLDGKQCDDRLLRFALLDGLAAVTFHRYSRYLQGRRFKKFKNAKLKLISWYENQTIDKTLYKGVRDGKSDAYILGAQLFLFSPLYMNVFVDENELGFGVVPDKVLVNGEYYLPASDKVRFEVGPSLRYKKLFEVEIPKINERESIVVLLSYVLDSAINVLRLVNQLDIEQEIIIKVHPAADIDSLKDFLKPNYKISLLDIYELAKNAKFIVTSATGAAVELASLGAPIIVVKGKSAFDDNAMIDLGKSVLWHEVDSKEELIRAVNLIKDMKDDDALLELGREYKRIFFNKPNMANIIKAFEI